MVNLSTFSKFLIVLSIICLLVALKLILVFKMIEAESFKSFLNTVKRCNHENVCLREKFKNLTVASGRDTAFKYYNQLKNTELDYLSNCHYIFHGIGKGSVGMFKNNISKVFTVNNYQEILNDVPTCGNGYYHGAIEEIVEGFENEKIEEKLTSLCIPILNSDKQVVKDCYHGLGHAIFTQSGSDTKESLKVCERVTSGVNEEMTSMCRTGVFMELVNLSNEMGVTSFEPCLNQESDIYSAECFNMQSYLFDEFSKQKEKFIENMKACQKTSLSTEDKIICIRKEKL